MAIRLKVQTDNDIKLKVGESDAVHMKGRDGIPIYPNPYTGPTEVSPTEEEQTLSTNGLMMTSDVTVDAIPPTYIGSDIPQRTGADVSVSGATVSFPEGYYAEGESKTVQSGSATTPTGGITANPTISVSDSGLISASVTKSESITPIVSEGYVTSGTAGTITFSGSSTSQLSTQGSSTITPTKSEQTAVTSGKYTTGDVKVGPIPSQYIVPEGTKSIDANGTGIDVTEYAAVDVAVPGPDLQSKSKTYTPSTSQQSDTISADTGYDGLSQVAVTVNAMPTGTEGTPTATKGTVSNHSVSVTPSVTNTAGYIAGGTKTGTAVSVSASELVSGTKSITANGTNIDVTSYASVDVAVPSSQPTLETVTKTYTPTTSQQTETITPSSGYDGIGEVDVTVNAMPNGVVTAPATITGTNAGKSTSTNTLTFTTTIPVTPVVTTAGYVSAGTARNVDVSLSADMPINSSSSLQVSGATVTAPAGYYASNASATVASGTQGTPTATKDTVSNHAVRVTPSVTNSAGYISGGTRTGEPVTVSASELVSGSETKTANGTYDVTNLAELIVNVSGGGGSNWTLLGSSSYTVSTTSSSATEIGTISCGSAAVTSSAVIWVRVRGRKGPTAGYFYGSDAIFLNPHPANETTGAYTFSNVGVLAIRYASATTRYAVYNGQYGVYAYSIKNDGVVSIRRRYNSSYSLTINDTFDVEVYKLTLPTGKALFT